MIIHRAYRVELDPNNRQRGVLMQHAGTARWAYNWGLARKFEAYAENGKRPSAFALQKELVVLKKTSAEDGGVPWLSSVARGVPREALKNLDRAFSDFFRRCKEGARHKGFPRFKSKHKTRPSFRLADPPGISKCGTKIRLPKIGWLRVKRAGYLPCPSHQDVRPLSVSVSKVAGRWFASVTVKQISPDFPRRPRTKVVGVDLGIKSLAVTSDGLTFKNPRAMACMDRQLRRAQRSVSRKRKGSKNRSKARYIVARIHYRIACIRADAIHKTTAAIVQSADVVCIESLNVSGMLKNRRLARAVSDASFAEVLRQIRYKAEWAGVEVVEAPRFFPSSKTCSGCGKVKKDLSLSDRIYRCSACGLVLDRDLNAAINLRNLAAESAVSACGGGSSGPCRKTGTKLPPMKQEPSSAFRA